MDIDQITLGGYTVAELKKMQKTVRQDANKFIADNLKIGTALVEEILKGREELVEGDEGFMDDATVEAKGAEAAEILKAVDLVAGVSGCTYYLPWDYDYDSPYYYRLENCEGLYELDIDPLFNILDSMQSDSRNWHESRC